MEWAPLPSEVFQCIYFPGAPRVVFLGGELAGPSWSEGKLLEVRDHGMLVTSLWHL